jgi:primase-polymerase (primpol)-like protein
MISIQQKRIPPELIARPQWVLWRYLQRPGKSKPDKIPHTTMGYKADVTNQDHWSTFEFALQMARRPGFCDGLGYAFSDEDPFTGIDLDNVWLSDADEGADWAWGIIRRFQDTYGETSPSNCGWKIWCRAKAPRCGRWPIGAGAVEIYDHSRFFTVTSRSNGILTVADHQCNLEALITNLYGDRCVRPPAATIPSVIPKGRRHPTLVSLAGSMHRRGMMPAAVEAALLVTNEQQCDPPYPPEHIRQIVRSMQRWER